MAYLAARRALASVIGRTFSESSSLSSRSRFAFAVLNQRAQLVPGPVQVPTRFKTSGPAFSPLPPNWRNRPLKETLLPAGCDFEHWLVVLGFPDPKPSEEEMINSYVKTLASVVGSEEEAKKKIYSVCTTTFTGFGALISEELSVELKAVPGVLWVMPDSYQDALNKDYGGDLFIDGKVIPRPEYRFTDRQRSIPPKKKKDRQPSRNRPLPRHYRRRKTMQVERRTPMQNRTENMREPAHQPTSTFNQNAAQGGPGDISENRSNV